MEIIKNDRGVAIVYVALFLLVLGILFIAVGIDMGWIVYVRSQAQASVDAAALAGAGAIPNYDKVQDPTQVYNLITDLNPDNTVMKQDAGIAAADIEFCSGDSGSPTCGASVVPAEGVKVTKSYSAPLFFASLLNGGNGVNLTFTATAWLGGPSSGKPQLPLAVRICQVNFPNGCGATPTLIQSPNAVDNSAFSTFFSTGGSDCTQMVTGATPIPTVQIGDTINLVGSGQVTNCLKALSDAFTKNASSTDCPSGVSLCWNVTLAVIDCSGNQATGKVVGFATIAITQVTVPPAAKTISGSLTCFVNLPGSIGTGPDLGTFADRPVLVQ